MKNSTINFLLLQSETSDGGFFSNISEKVTSLSAIFIYAAIVVAVFIVLIVALISKSGKGDGVITAKLDTIDMAGATVKTSEEVGEKVNEGSEPTKEKKKGKAERERFNMLLQDRQKQGKLSTRKIRRQRNAKKDVRRFQELLRGEIAVVLRDRRYTKIYRGTARQSYSYIARYVRNGKNVFSVRVREIHREYDDCNTGATDVERENGLNRILQRVY